MYSKYIAGSFSPINHKPHQSVRNAEKLDAGGRQKIIGDATGLIKNIMKQFSMEKFDTGDILLILIILLLFIEGDNLDTVITLGLMLLFTLNDSN